MLEDAECVGLASSPTAFGIPLFDPRKRFVAHDLFEPLVRVVRFPAGG